MKLNPDDQFKATEASIQTVLEKYLLKLISFEAAKSGIENTTILLGTDKGEFVLRIYRQNKKIDAAIDEEIKFTNFLAQNGLPVPKVVANLEGRYLTHLTVNGLQWQVILMSYIGGTHAEDYSLPLVKSMAHLQAQMHKLSETYDYNQAVFPMLPELRETAIIKQIKGDGLDDKLVAFLKRAEKYVLNLSTELPSGICHLDYSKGNILVDDSGNVTAILDFDDMEAAPYAVCLGFALYHLRLGGSGQSEQEEYLRQYQAVRELSKLEIDILPSVQLFRHYFIGSLQIFHHHRSEKDITNYLQVEEDLVSQVEAVSLS